MATTRIGVAGAHFPAVEQEWDVARFVARLPPTVEVYVYGYHGVDRVAFLVAQDLGIPVTRIFPSSPLDSSNDALYQFVDLSELHCWLAPVEDRDPVSTKIRAMTLEGVPWTHHR